MQRTHTTLDPWFSSGSFLVGVAHAAGYSISGAILSPINLDMHVFLIPVQRPLVIIV